MAYPSRVGASEQLGALWPEVSQRVGRVLRSRGLHGDRVADVLQEVAVRALRADAPVDSVDRLAAWAYVVATRVLIDDARARGTLALVDDPAAAARLDPSRVVEGRIEWERTLRAMARLSLADRAILLSAFDDVTEVAGDRREAVRNAVRRHRARARLAAAMDRLAAAVGSVLLRIRRLWVRGAGAVVIGGTTVIAVVLGLFPGAHRDTADASSPPIPSVALPQPTAASAPTTAAVPSAPKPAPPSAPIGGGSGGGGGGGDGGDRTPPVRLPPNGNGRPPSPYWSDNLDPVLGVLDPALQKPPKPPNQIRL